MGKSTAALLTYGTDPEGKARVVLTDRRPTHSPHNRAARRLSADASAPTPLDRLLNAGEVAEWVNTTPGQLSQWRFQGEGPPFIKLGRAVRYRRADVEAWLDANTRTQT